MFSSMERPRFVYIHQLRHSWFVTILWLSCVRNAARSIQYTVLCGHVSSFLSGVRRSGIAGSCGDAV